ncbi:MAG: response regulator [Denitratisoma sp.]|nr:response regulator [Denitratisoma sp.]
MRLLIIDAARPFLEAARHCAEDAGDCRVSTAVSAEAGIRAARAMRPDIVLADHELRTRDGRSVIPLLRQLLPEATLVCLTLDDEGEAARALRRRNADVCLEKPRLAEALPELLAGALH